MNHLPNILSLFRLIISQVFFILLISENSSLILLAYILYIVGAISDYLDGLLARRYNAMTKFGNFFDPLADKFLTSFAFVGFAVMQIIPTWMVIVVIFRDTFTTVIRIYQFESKTGLITSQFAKWKTFLQMIFIFGLLTLILIFNLELINLSRDNYLNILSSPWIDYFMGFITLISIWTLLDYAITVFKKPVNNK